MKRLNTEDKLDIIIRLVKEHQIKISHLSKGTNIAPATIMHLLNCETANPQERTLDTLLDYLNQRLSVGDENICLPSANCEAIIKALQQQLDLKNTVNALLEENNKLLKDKISFLERK